MLKLLVIDDHIKIHNMLQRRLVKYDYKISCVIGIPEAIEYLKENKPDIILIDYFLHNSNGLEFFEFFEFENNVPVIMMTGHSSVNLVIEFFKSGGTDFIEKPIDIDILHLKIQQAYYNYKKIDAERSERMRVENELAISHKALQEKTNQLEQTNCQLSAFAGVVAHDLKSPLTGQNIFVSQMLKKINSGSADLHEHFCQENLNFLQESGKEMLDLINTLLDFSQYQSLNIKLEEVDSNKIIKDIVNSHQQNKNIIIDADNLPIIKAQPTLIKQVFTNLIQNAIKYSANRDIQRISVSAELNKTDVIFSVSDNGIGFAKEKADAIFTMFTRLETTTNFEGRGIGLAIVKSIIDKHSGKIWVESAINKGSCFYFSLPM
jgi:light-regulated signal transduction histidine kinase (bacteriophytochrome)